MYSDKRIFTVCLILGVLVVVAFFFSVSPLPHPPLWQIEMITELKFPKDSKVIGSNGSFLFGHRIFANIEIDKQYLNVFINSLKHPPQKSDEYTKMKIDSLSSGKTEWWHPEKIKKPLYFNFEVKHNESARHYDIIIDVSYKTKAYIYLVYLT